MNLYLRILKFIRPYLGRLIAAGFCTVMTAAANLYVPGLSAMSLIRSSRTRIVISLI